MAVLAALGFAGVAAAAPPNLTPFIDTNSDVDNTNASAVKAWFVDTTANPYSAKLRFGTQIANRAGAGPFQIGAKAGTPNAPTAVQLVDGGTNKDLTAITLVKDDFNNGFADWRLNGLASYTLTPTSGPNVNSAIGPFCRVDDAIFEGGAGLETFSTAGCNNKPSVDAAGFSSGISAGWQDVLPASASNSAFFDVTSVTPGPATFTATIDPANELTESTKADNTKTAPITVPGVAATGANLSTTTTTPVSTNVAAAIVGGDVLGKTQAQGAPAKANGILTYGVTQPANGKVVLAGTTVTYTANSGFTGTDAFTFTATDSRGLQGTATVSVAVNGVATTPGGGTTGGGTTGGGTTVTRLTLKLKPSYTVVRKGKKTFLRVSGKLPASQVGRSVKIQRKVGKRVSTIGSAKIARTGRYTALILVKSARVSLRVTIPASATAKGSTTAFKRLVIAKKRS